MDQRDMAAAIERASQALGELVSLLIRSPEHNGYAVADLEWMLMPAVINKQFLIIRGPVAGTEAPLPVGALIWAALSPDLFNQMKQTPGQRLKLTREERISGTDIWITDTIGDPRVWNNGLQHLRSGELAGRKIGMVVKDSDGTLSVVELMP